jgi:hypothetical protein
VKALTKFVLQKKFVEKKKSHFKKMTRTLSFVIVVALLMPAYAADVQKCPTNARTCLGVTIINGSDQLKVANFSVLSTMGTLLSSTPDLSCELPMKAGDTASFHAGSGDLNTGAGLIVSVFLDDGSSLVVSASKPWSQAPSVSLSLGRSSLNETSYFTAEFDGNRRLEVYVLLSEHALTQSKEMGGATGPLPFPEPSQHCNVKLNQCLVNLVVGNYSSPAEADELDIRAVLVESGELVDEPPRSSCVASLESFPFGSLALTYGFFSAGLGETTGSTSELIVAVTPDGNVVATIAIKQTGSVARQLSLGTSPSALPSVSSKSFNGGRTYEYQIVYSGA